MAARRRWGTIVALAAAAAAHGLIVAWLAVLSPGLSFRAAPDPDRGVVLLSLQPLGEATAAKTLRPAPPAPAPRPKPRAPSPPVAAAGGAPGAELANLARPVFRVWPRPLPSGVNWGAAEPADCPAALRARPDAPRPDCPRLLVLQTALAAPCPGRRAKDAPPPPGRPDCVMR